MVVVPFIAAFAAAFAMSIAAASGDQERIRHAIVLWAAVTAVSVIIAAFGALRIYRDYSRSRRL